MPRVCLRHFLFCLRVNRRPPVHHLKRHQHGIPKVPRGSFHALSIAHGAVAVRKIVLIRAVSIALPGDLLFRQFRFIGFKRIRYIFNQGSERDRTRRERPAGDRRQGHTGTAPEIPT